MGKDTEKAQRTRKYAVFVDSVDEVPWVVELGQGG